MKHSILNEKQKKPQPRYSLERHRSRWAVYDETTNKKVFDSFDNEAARKRMYELNEWEYK